MNIIKGNIVDVVNKRIYKGEIHFSNIIEKIIEKEVEENIYILPGLVNAHVHIESSMLSPLAFSKYAIKHGTVAVVTDPHEIANVCGEAGLEYMIENAKYSPLKIYFGVPSCVPATTFETSGAVLDSAAVSKLLASENFIMLSEMMNFPGVIYDDKEVWAKINAAKLLNKPIDGHAPQLTGEPLKKYIAVAGILTDHECSTYEEALEKIKYGMKIQIREGSAAKNFDTLKVLIDSHPDKIMFCTDDSHPDDLLEGHINLIVKKAWHLNYNYFDVLRAATYNPIKHYNLQVGLLQKGDAADFIVSDSKYLKNILNVFINGKEALHAHFSNDEIKNINQWNPTILNKEHLIISSTNNTLNIIGCIDGELLTKHLTFKYEDVFNSDGSLKNGFDKIVVVNRYISATPVVGIIKGVNLNQGAFGGTIAHDSHNIIICGHNDEDIINVFNLLNEYNGGIAISLNDNSMGLPLPIGGLMTSEDALTVATKYNQLQSFAKEILGSTLKAPFMTLSFMALLVIPELKIGDKGMFNITKFDFVPLENK
ncbi:MAG: adenine deaminase [Bacteroidales bacterium]